VVHENESSRTSRASAKAVGLVLGRSVGGDKRSV